MHTHNCVAGVPTWLVLCDIKFSSWLAWKLIDVGNNIDCTKRTMWSKAFVAVLWEIKSFVYFVFISGIVFLKKH
jgi:hypothetical protein